MENIDLEKLRKDAMGLFGGHQGFFCSEAIVSTIGKHMGVEEKEIDTLVRTSTGFGIGIGGSKCSCGALTGGVIMISNFFGRSTAGNPKSERCFALCNELHSKFIGTHKVACCKILTRKVQDNATKHFEQCQGITGEVAYEAAKIIQREKAKEIE